VQELATRTGQELSLDMLVCLNYSELQETASK
jgi:hypothetical protein